MYLIANCPVLATSNSFWPLNISCCKEPLKLGEEDVTMEPASIPPICISVYPIWLAVPMISAVENKEIRSKLHLEWILFSHSLGEAKAFPVKEMSSGGVKESLVTGGLRHIIEREAEDK